MPGLTVTERSPVWLAASPSQIKQLLAEVGERLGDEPTTLERDASAIEPAKGDRACEGGLMSRKPRHRRRRPGRRLPANGPVHHPSLPISRDLTSPGWIPAPTVILPHRGRDERPFSCDVDEGMIAGAGLVGVVLGWIDLGLLGAALGLWAGVKLCRMALEDDRPSRR